LVIEPIDPDGRTLARGGLMRGWNRVLKQRGMLHRIGTRLTEDVAALLGDPPATTEWVDVAYYECVAEAVLQEVGEAQLAELFVDASRTGWAVLISRWGGSIVRVFGASPAIVLKHAEAAAKANTVGFALEWRPLGEREGDVFAHYPFRSRIHPAAAWGTAAACEIAGEAVGLKLRRERPRVEPGTRGGTSVRVRVSW
jgi:hypothetical protein